MFIVPCSLTTTLTSDNSEDGASSVDAHLSASSRTSLVPIPYTPAQQITATNPTICPLITTLAPLVTASSNQQGHLLHLVSPIAILLRLQRVHLAPQDWPRRMPPLHVSLLALAQVTTVHHTGLVPFLLFAYHART
jgi:hypothetical protein